MACVNMLNNPEVDSYPTSNVSDAFVAYEIVPHIINVPPTELLHVKFAASNKEVSLGNVMTPQETSKQPEIKFEADPEGLYALIMVDPDVPSRRLQFLKSVKHWIVVNIRGSDLTSGKSLGDFLRPGPPMATGLHRYIFLVYKQQRVLDINRPGKFRFNIKRFATENNLGDPICGNFFRARSQLL